MHDAAVDHLDILFSADGMTTWTPVTEGTPDDSVHVWTTPDVASSACHLMLVAESAGGDVLGIGVTGAFTIGGEAVGVEDPLPARFALLAAAPNPFSASTHVRFELARQTPVSLRLFALDGSLVRVLAEDRVFPAGRHAVVWDGRDETGRRAPGGVYFVRIEAGGDEAVRKLVRAGR
jgi:hypothetical protein